MAGTRATSGISGRYNPTPDEVRLLLRRAAEHPLGTEFLTGGALDAVAATFGVHAFLVEAARRVHAPTLVRHGTGSSNRNRPG
jgi:hypothetical protein